MKVFVTGATGFIGGHVARAAVAAGHEVTALVRSPAGARALRAAGIGVVHGDVTQAESLLRAVAGHEAVLHFAVLYAHGVRPRERSLMEAINVRGTEHVLSAARHAGARMIHCSSIPAWYGVTSGEAVDETYRRRTPPADAYERTKHRAHALVLKAAAAGMPVSVVLPGSVYGPGDRSATGPLFRLFPRGWVRVFAAPDAGQSWVHVDDVAQGVMAALLRGRPGEMYNLGGENLTYRRLFAVLSELTGVVPPLFLPGAVVPFLRPLGRLPVALGPFHFGRLDQLLVASLGTYFCSTDKARSELGYEPRPFRVGAAQTLATLGIAGPSGRTRS